LVTDAGTDRRHEVSVPTIVISANGASSIYDVGFAAIQKCVDVTNAYIIIDKEIASNPVACARLQHDENTSVVVAMVVKASFCGGNETVPVIADQALLNGAGETGMKSVDSQERQRQLWCPYRIGLRHRCRWN